MQSESAVTNGIHSVHEKDVLNIRDENHQARTRCQRPIPYAGLLDAYPHRELTPVIGREFENLQLADLLNAPNRDELIRDLAVTISRRGVCFFRSQDVSPGQMRELTQAISCLAGCPLSSADSLHTHPLAKDHPELGGHIGVISSEAQKQGGGITRQRDDYSRLASVGWHSDITFEPVPSDYAMLKIHTLPPTGGDTLWASGYEIYDRLSPPMQAFLEGLTATHDANFFHEDAARLGQCIRERVRGSPLNHSTDLRAQHLVIRTNPVTGWKSVFVNRGFTRRINGVTKDESDLLLQHLFDLAVQNHDLQVRFRWDKDDVAVWDNRSTLHCATYDFPEVRTGDRACSVGEAPYFDPASKSRRLVLQEEASRD